MVMVQVVSSGVLSLLIKGAERGIVELATINKLLQCCRIYGL
jgi:hypothetical protein